ncbi:MAG: DNA replication/repair protein RecF [Chlamydiia bacterium]|nr:DNA replication/repair protein RecF [Chlamydiia bacterium]
MQIKALYLKDFRNYKEEIAHFSPEVNIIFGKNGQGKTNLLEAIYFLITGRSFRTSYIKDLIAFEKKGFYLEAHFEKAKITQTLKILYSKQEKKIFLNQTPIPNFSSLFGILNGVVLSPLGSGLIDGPPSVRRQFFDISLSQSTPLYLHHLRRYTRALKQRNALLKIKQLHSIEAFEEQMAYSALYLQQTRQQMIEKLVQLARPIQEILSSKEEALQLIYKTSLSKTQTTEAYLTQLEKNRQKELALGYTLTGPHRDDILIQIQGKEALSFASEGQKRIGVTSLTLANWERLRQVNHELPLFCIDDLGIFLDHKREEALYQFLPTLGQVFVTTPRAFKSTHLLVIENGKIMSDDHSNGEDDL